MVGAKRITTFVFLGVVVLDVTEKQLAISVFQYLGDSTISYSQKISVIVVVSYFP